MTKQRMIELLEIEHECMLRKSHDVCDSNCCVCELAQDDYELHEMYINVVSILRTHGQKTCNECRHYDANAFSDLGGKCGNSMSCHYCYGCDKSFGCNAWEGR